MEGIADIYVIYFQASLFPLTLAPAPQQGQLTVSTSYMNVTLRHKSVDISAPRLDFRRLQGAVSDPPRTAKRALSGDECGLIFPNSGW